MGTAWAAALGDIKPGDRTMSRAKKRKMQAAKGAREWPVWRPNAAGVDIGATEIYAAGPPERDPEPVPPFPPSQRTLLVSCPG
jgi:hypothetical protein